MEVLKNAENTKFAEIIRKTVKSNKNKKQVRESFTRVRYVHIFKVKMMKGHREDEDEPVNTKIVRYKVHTNLLWTARPVAVR